MKARDYRSWRKSSFYYFETNETDILWYGLNIYRASSWPRSAAESDEIEN
jgi:hypothetical protein